MRLNKLININNNKLSQKMKTFPTITKMFMQWQATQRPRKAPSLIRKTYRRVLLQLLRARIRLSIATS